MKEIELGDRSVGEGFPPFIVAELSGNHKSSLERTMALVEAAARCGVDAIKLQTYTADTMTISCDEPAFRVNEQDSLWKGRTLHDLYQEGSLPWEWHAEIFSRCRELGLCAFSTPFDPTAVDFLEKLDVPAYKIASQEILDLQLIRRVAGTGKPLIISSGMANIAEIDEAVRTARCAGCKDLVLLKCTSTYPATPQDSHLRTIPHMRDLFNVQTGLSDHTLGIGTAIAAIAQGAVLIEKHFTLDRKDGSLDGAFSAEPAEMTTLVIETKKAWQALGQIHYGPVQKEQESLRYRRSLYLIKDLNAGDKLDQDSVRAIRPGEGLAPRYIDLVLGRSITRTAKRGTPLTWDLIGE